MKSIARIISCIAFVFLLAIFAPAQGNKPAIGGNLSFATTGGHTAAAQALLARGAEANVKDKETTPSFDCGKAATWSEIEVCRDDKLSVLDRQVAQLYQDAMAQVTDNGKKALISDQRAWLRQREDCKNRPDKSACLFRVYDARISQLHSAVGSQQTGEPAAGSCDPRKGQTAPLSEITSNVVWHDASEVWECNDVNHYPDGLNCLLAKMRTGGATAEAIAFTRQLNRMENDGWVDSFTEYGRVDLISASYPFRANTNGGFLLVNGTPTVINTESLTLSASDKRRSDYRRLIKRRPSVSLIMKLQFDHHEQLSGGGQRFVFTDYFSECRACELAATGYFAFDFDQEGCFIGTQMLRITLPLDPTKSR